jgi:hypothetical protein
MKHVSLNGQDKSVRDFVLELAAEPGGSVLELDGRPVAQMVPVPVDRNGNSTTADDWNDAKNDRRCELVDRQIDGVLTPAEAAELADLQQQMLRYRDHIAPLPLDYARKLHQELMKLAQTAEPSPGA